MPTGYTASVMDGKITDFRQFAMQCARAFGALINMRDDAWDAPIPEQFKPSDYHVKALATAKLRYDELRSMTPEQLKEACNADYRNRLAGREKYKAEQKIENDRLDAMLAEVEKWTPPTGNHAEMKTFMREQIRISRNDLSTLDKYDPVVKMTPQEWLGKELEKSQRDVGYHAGEQEKEVERAKGRTLWVKQLRDSLSTVTP